MIWRIRDRDGFARLRREGRRSRRGPVQVVAVLDPSAVPPRVAFAIGRAVGGSVVRNRLRRRLREAFRALAVQGDLPGGWYLVSGRPELDDLPFDQLTALVRDVVAGVGRSR